MAAGSNSVTAHEANSAIKVMAGAYPLFAHHIGNPEAHAVWMKLLLGLDFEAMNEAVARICTKGSQKDNITTAAFMQHVWNIKADRAAAGQKVARIPAGHEAEPSVVVILARWAQIRVGGRVEPRPSELEREIIERHAEEVRSGNRDDGLMTATEREELLAETKRLYAEATDRGERIQNIGCAGGKVF